MRSFNKHQGSLELHRVAALRRQRVDCNEVRRLALHGFYGASERTASKRICHTLAPQAHPRGTPCGQATARGAALYKTSYAAALSDSPKDV